MWRQARASIRPLRLVANSNSKTLPCTASMATDPPERAGLTSSGKSLSPAQEERIRRSREAALARKKATGRYFAEKYGRKEGRTGSKAHKGSFEPLEGWVTVTKAESKDQPCHRTGIASASDLASKFTSDQCGLTTSPKEEVREDHQATQPKLEPHSQQEEPRHRGDPLAWSHAEAPSQSQARTEPQAQAQSHTSSSSRKRPWYASADRDTPREQELFALGRMAAQPSLRSAPTQSSLKAEHLSITNSKGFLAEDAAGVPRPQAGDNKAAVLLSPQQVRVLQALAQGKSVFVTGSAGTGKSFLLDFAIRQLRVMHGAESVHVTASTGIAACAIGGGTLHAFAGIGLGESKAEVLLGNVMRKRELRTRWQLAKALVVDEISMIDGPLLDKLDFIGRSVRNSARPFGGIQLLVTGDFFQLPPVSRGQDKQFAFDAKCWRTCFDLQVQLSRVFRQAQGDFVALLNQIRQGHLSPEAHSMLTRQMQAPSAWGGEKGEGGDGIVATKLYPYRVDVAAENLARLQELPGPEHVFRALDETEGEFAAKLLENTRAESVLTLRLGAQVMLLKNLDTGRSLVNGSRGLVVGFVPVMEASSAEHRPFASTVGACGVWPVVRFACDGVERVMGPEMWSIERNGMTVAKRTQVPLALAWALSVHKCQGMTLDRVETDLSRAFDYGMVYVALSRVRSLQGLHLKGFDPSKIKVHPKVAQFYDNLKETHR